MKLVPGTDIWMPDSEMHFLERVKTGQPRAVDYQADRLKEAYRHCRNFRVAVDVGAHVGLLTRKLAEKFDQVLSFEPCLETFECLVKNTEHLPNVTRYNVAVGGTVGRIGLDKDPKKNSGDRQVQPDGKNTPLISLDSLQLDSVDLLKVDVQGYEEMVLRGAAALLRYCRPVVVIENEPDMPEQLGLSARGAYNLLRHANALKKATLGADEIWAFPPADNIPFDKYEKNGDYHWQKYETSKAHLAMIELIVNHVKSYDDATILDVGCGDGLMTYLMGAYGIDNSAAAIAEARKHSVNCQILSVQEVEKLGRQWDAVCLFDTLEHLFDQRGVIETLGKVTGKIHILNPEPNSSPYHTREFQADELATWMLELGWKEAFRKELMISGDDLKCLFTFVKA